MATVSRALRGLDNVNEETQRLVEESARALDYVVDSRASSLASGRTNTIGVVAPLFHTWYASRVVAGIAETIAAGGYDLLVYSVENITQPLESLNRSLRGQRVDGLVFVDVQFDHDAQQVLGELQVPFATVGYTTANGHAITIDEEAAARMATQHLIELGHENLIFLGSAQPGELSSPVSTLREAAVRKTASAAGLHGAAIPFHDGSFTIEGGQRVARDLLASNERPTGVVCASDEMAVGFISEVWHQGCSIPGDFSVVGFDGHEMAPLFDLTTVNQNVFDKGVRAAEAVLASLEDCSCAIEHVEAPLELIVRGSTAQRRRSVNL